MEYDPKTIETAGVTFTREILELTERLAENAHSIWARQRLSDGWRHGPQRDDAKKEHPCLVPYEDLPESEKQYDRNAAMETLKAIVALGYRIEGSTARPPSASILSGSAPEVDPVDEQLIGAILTQLDLPGARVPDLLQVYQGQEYRKLWQLDARLYRAFGKKLIGAGHPTKGFELVREGLVSHKNDLDLNYLSALALARGGNVPKADEYVQEILKDPRLDERLMVETLSLAGRLAKDKYERATTATLKSKLANESAQRYVRAHQLAGACFPGINAATMSLLAEQRKKPRELAAIVVKQANAERAQPGMENDYWLLATLGEANIILGHLAEAASWYRRAVQHAAGHLGDIAAMRRNVLLLTQKAKVSDEILGLFNIGSVVAFSGHMIDDPARGERKLPPRFPPDPELERAVAQAIGERLDELGATIGYCSAACGSDILFAEGMLKRGAELHVVLPFDKNDFYRTSVDFGLPEMSKWRERCDQVLTRAAEVHYATSENYLEDSVLFQFVNTFTQGLALTRAAQLGVEPYALAVLDPSAKKLFGGTAYFLDRWTAAGRQGRTIDLAAIRSTIDLKLPAPMRAAKPTEPKETVVPIRKMGRRLQAMLFADVKNFSKLTEKLNPTFFTRFPSEVARVLHASKHKPIFWNTWGDGLYLVFENVVDCADFAMRLLDRIAKVDWEKMGLPKDTAVRMGIHAGPVYPWMDKVIKRKNFVGSHVNRAARIEPVATPGCAFTSEQFAAALIVEPGHDFICEYVGQKDLAKDYDRVTLYRLARRGAG